jgi:serine/threonine-protein kinase
MGPEREGGGAYTVRGAGIFGGKDVAEDLSLTHPLSVSEAFVGMMVTPSVKLVRPLGEGGMGTVWVAEHLALRTQVVVKFIAHGLKSNKEAQGRFSREAAAASQVKSPHVVQTFDHGLTDQGIPYIVMELLDGRDLGEYMEREGRVAPDLVVDIVGQLARALDRAHEKGIIHRDIKPGNIYLCDVGRSGEVFVKLLDFGIAKGVELLGGSADGIDSGTKTGSMIGSPFYMSPEQILGSKGIDHRSDLWSVGVLTFEMLTGAKPFDAETMGGLAIKIHSEPMPAPSSVNPGLPPAVDAWFEKACSREISKRYASAKELAEELSRALGGQMPRSLDNPARISRISTKGSRAVSGHAPTLAAGAGTDAGLVRSPTPSRSRGRLLVLLAILVVVPPVAYVGSSAIFKKPSTALFPAAPVASAAGVTARVEPKASPTPTTTLILTAALSTAAPPDSGHAVASANTLKPGAGHSPRPRIPASAHPSPPFPPSSSSSAPPLPSTAAPPLTTPRPVTSGHDIF